MQAPSPNSKGVNSNLEESRPCETLLSLRLQKTSWLQKPGRQQSEPWTPTAHVGLILRKKINSRRSYGLDNVDVQSVQLKRERRFLSCLPRTGERTGRTVGLQGYRSNRVASTRMSKLSLELGVEYMEEYGAMVRTNDNGDWSWKHSLGVQDDSKWFPKLYTLGTLEPITTMAIEISHLVASDLQQMNSRTMAVDFGHHMQHKLEESMQKVTALPCISYGEGQWILANLAHGRQNHTELDRLLENSAIKCLVAIEFPTGSTAHVLSSILQHSNAAVQSGETQFSFTQYFAGGLISLAELQVQDYMIHHKI
ncbi:hypothetical protein EDB19DRAFT_1824048 [Suillus lakei]|nr:hypothetical protein EDB19DRAFT_1824048 [Suillus lakei]